MIYEEIGEIFAAIIGADNQDITPETELTAASGVEMISVAKLIIECEKAYHITIFDEDVHTFKCIDDLVTYVNRLLSEGASSSLATDQEREAWYYT